MIVAYKELTKILRKGAKRQAKKPKAVRKNQVNKNKEKEGIYVKQVNLYSTGLESALFKIGKIFLYFLHVLCVFALFQHYFTLFLKKLKSCLHAIAYELQCYYYLHILYNLVVLYLHV